MRRVALNFFFVCLAWLVSSGAYAKPSTARSCCDGGEERDAGATVTKRFLGAGEQISGTNYFFTRDHLGSVRELTDGSGAIRARYDYDPYGRRTKVQGDLEADFGFTGHYYHQSSGLHLALYRAYDTEAGRWLNQDPIGELGGLNLYSYVYNNPINFVDPFGLWSPGAHDALIEHALKDILPKSELDILNKSSRAFDKATQSSDESHKHSMRKKGQSVEDAIKQRDKFINDKLNACKKANADGNRNEALRLLGEALHPIMDASSPMHSDSQGNPKEWNPWKPLGHSFNDHIGNETVKDITPEIYKQQDKAIRDAYEKVFGK